MKDLLIGSTGFVGGNLQREHSFYRAFHSTDVTKAFGMRPELCVYAGVPSAMFLANESMEADLAVMKQARENLRKILPEKIILISTVAVYSDCMEKDESFESDDGLLSIYGKNRLQLEKWVMEDHPDVHIVRLPALYGKGIKKNFLYDLHHIVPKMLTAKKYNEVHQEFHLLEKAYSLMDNGYYVLRDDCNKKRLKEFFSTFRFNALSFTDSRSNYQFYNLSELWRDIKIVIEIGQPVVNLVTPPISARNVYVAVTGKDDWINIQEKPPFSYDLRTKYDKVFNGSNGYICSPDEEIESICSFMKEWDLNES